MVEEPQSPPKEELSNWWYLAPIFLAIVGGGIAWFVNKDEYPKKARKLLIAGLVMTGVWMVLPFLLGAAFFAFFPF